MYPRGGSLSGGIIKGRQNSPVSGGGGGAVEMSRDFSARQREVKERRQRRGENDKERRKRGRAEKNREQGRGKRKD